MHGYRVIEKRIGENGGGWGMTAVYVMYKGEDLLGIGTRDELAKLHGVKKRTIHYYSTQAYRNKVSKRKNARNYITVEKLEDE